MAPAQLGLEQEQHASEFSYAVPACRRGISCLAARSRVAGCRGSGEHVVGIERGSDWTIAARMGALEGLAFRPGFICLTALPVR